MKEHPERLAVILMNLGGPDHLSDVGPFLKNLFSDPAILSVPWPLRPLLAEGISRLRTKKAKITYQEMGGGSPLLKNTKEQQHHLSLILQNQFPDFTIEIFVAMRYWNPLISEVVGRVKSFRPSQIVLLPLYPQFSFTTTNSSFKEWHKQANFQGLGAKTVEVVCYPQEESFIQAHLDLLKPWIEKAETFGKPRILFSAHGLPQKNIDRGDPYEKQVHLTAKAILKKLTSDVDSVVCYQSKVGPLRWLEPSLEQELQRASQEKTPVIVLPISFVSEHVETLIELDKDYRNLATRLGVPFYGRVPTLGSHPEYIKALANLIMNKIT